MKTSLQYKINTLNSRIAYHTIEAAKAQDSFDDAKCHRHEAVAVALSTMREKLQDQLFKGLN